MKLFVDDLREPWPDWHCARTITEAIRILATMPVEIVSLDHDIEQSVFGSLELETFEPVARYIAIINRDDYNVLVRFHTGNPIGGRRMADILGVTYETHCVDYEKTMKESKNL